MKKKKLAPALLLTVWLCTAAPLQARSTASNDKPLPVYLDPTKDVEARVEDALRRMTLDEKIAVIHAQSKFSAPGVKRLGLPDFWTDDGPHGVRPDVLWDEWEQAGQTNDSCVAFPALTCLADSSTPAATINHGGAFMGKPITNIKRNADNTIDFDFMGGSTSNIISGISVINDGVAAKSTGVYSLDGRYMGNTLEGLPHGVYITNGKKVVR